MLIGHAVLPPDTTFSVLWGPVYRLVSLCRCRPCYCTHSPTLNWYICDFEMRIHSFIVFSIILLKTKNKKPKKRLNVCLVFLFRFGAYFLCPFPYVDVDYIYCSLIFASEFRPNLRKLQFLLYFFFRSLLPIFVFLLLENFAKKNGHFFSFILFLSPSLSLSIYL